MAAARVLQSCSLSAASTTQPHKWDQSQSPRVPVNWKGVQEMVDGGLKRDGVIVLVGPHLTKDLLSICYAAALWLHVLPSWQIPNSNPLAPSLIPSIWPPKVTPGHRPLEEGSLIAFLLCRWARLLSMGCSQLIALMFTDMNVLILIKFSERKKIQEVHLERLMSSCKRQGPHPGFTAAVGLHWGWNQFGSWCPYCESHKGPTGPQEPGFLIRSMAPVSCLWFVCLKEHPVFVLPHRHNTSD